MLYCFSHVNLRNQVVTEIGSGADKPKALSRTNSTVKLEQSQTSPQNTKDYFHAGNSCLLIYGYLCGKAHYCQEQIRFLLLQLIYNLQALGQSPKTNIHYSPMHHCFSVQWSLCLSLLFSFLLSLLSSVDQKKAFCADTEPYQNLIQQHFVYAPTCCFLFVRCIK